MFSIDLQWKKVIISGTGTLQDPYVYGASIPLNLEMVEAWMKANAGPLYKGNSADADLSLWFSEDPGATVTDAIKAYWDALSPTSPEATGYKTTAQIAAAAAASKAAALASATTKLEALGLSASEIAAILG